MQKDAQNTNTSHKNITAEMIEAELAGTQCTKCGYNGCQPYAQAILSNEFHNKCQPGGQEVADALALLLSRPKIAAELPQEVPAFAAVKEDLCIGCTKCLQVCPTDAILGAPKQKHQIIQGDCTACGLCLPVCPTDCITLQPRENHLPKAKTLALVAAKKERQSQKLSREISNLQARTNTQVPTLKLDVATQEKLAKARQSATKKWTEKKQPVTPKLLKNKQSSQTDK